jgi:hypothetical protein
MRANPLIDSTALVTLTALLTTLTMPPLAVAQTAPPFRLRSAHRTRSKHGSARSISKTARRARATARIDQDVQTSIDDSGS